MTMTGLAVFDETVHLTNAWLHELSARMGWDDRRRAYRLLRLALHAIRDRLGVEVAAHVSAQLPLLLRGVFFEGWRPSKVPSPVRSLEAFLEPLRAGFSDDPAFDAEAAMREVIDVARLHMTEGEIAAMRRVMPDEIKALWSDPSAA